MTLHGTNLIILEEFKPMAALEVSLGAAVSQALSDLEACETDDKYTINQNVWHAWQADSQTCGVCLSGATIAKTLGVPHTESVDFGKEPVKANYAMLDRIDDVQRGKVSDAIHKAEQVREGDGWAVSVLSQGADCKWLRANGYDGDPERFKAAIRSIAEQLTKVGL